MTKSIATETAKKPLSRRRESIANSAAWPLMSFAFQLKRSCNTGPLFKVSVIGRIRRLQNVAFCVWCNNTLLSVIQALAAQNWRLCSQNIDGDEILRLA